VDEGEQVAHEAAHDATLALGLLAPAFEVLPRGRVLGDCARDNSNRSLGIVREETCGSDVT
jgi:hypothetical protein